MGRLKEDIKIFLTDKEIEKIQAGRTLAFEEVDSHHSVIISRIEENPGEVV